MLWRECLNCKEEKRSSVIGCYDNNGDAHSCKKCRFKNCPDPNDKISSGFCKECLTKKKRKLTKKKYVI